jgi:hypothetical protein
MLRPVFSDGVLFAAAMDANRGELRGAAFPVPENLGSNATRGVGHFAVSASAIFAALTGVTVSERTIE